MAKKVRGNNRIRLSLRGAHREERLKARRAAYESQKMSEQEKRAFHKPGSNKK